MGKEILGVLCSGRGTNLQSIMAAVDSGQIPAPHRNPIKSSARSAAREAILATAIRLFL